MSPKRPRAMALSLCPRTGSQWTGSADQSVDPEKAPPSRSRDSLLLEIGRDHEGHLRHVDQDEDAEDEH